MICLACGAKIEETPTHGMHEKCFCAEFGVEPQSDFQDLFERKSVSGPKGPKDPAFKKFNSSFFHGRYRKYSGTLGKKNYIIKVQESECPELPAVEFVCNQLARLLGLPTPDFHFISLKNQSHAFMSRNLMDTHAPATLDHIYKFIKDDSEFDCATLCRLVQEQTGRISEVYKLVEICLFDAMIGNHDRHGRNIAFITKSGGTRTLSPFYDNPSYIGIADELMLGYDLSPRGTIATQDTKEPTLRDYLAEFRRLGLEDAVDRFKQKITSRTSAIIGTINVAKSLSPKRKSALITLIEKRIQELEDGQNK